MSQFALCPNFNLRDTVTINNCNKKPFTSSVAPPSQSLQRLNALSTSVHFATLSGSPVARTSKSTPSPFSIPHSRGAPLAPRSAAPDSTMASSSPPAGSPLNRNLLVVGPGVLGSVLARDWLVSVPGATATGLTNTERSHDRLRALGIQPATRVSLQQQEGQQQHEGGGGAGAGRRWSFVAFSAPPSGSQDYVADVRSALSLWDGTGCFLFTSSMSVCAVDDGGAVDDMGEEGRGCPLVTRGSAPGTDKLLGAEEAVLQAGGCVLRLVGLYHANRGAHTYFIRAGSVPRPGGYLVNLLHYEDAAGLGAAILRGDGSGPFRGRVFVGTDGQPVTFEDMVEACFSSGVFPRAPVTFTGAFPEDPRVGRGKVVSNPATRAALGGWAPRYPSFAAFMAAGGKDWYGSCGLEF
ncbi:hypothetical protein Agub_g7282 [Astrephomene gubernaculifera]|uniref:Uncharacterized protein n=1 Tax=Astrephomene gubernaculifera TaxID=47775 RepID=A0AAD3HME4_9CHLO|nr:hypothetical protein Agub_g7282 [Astrephomene gubernaculifera]